MAIRKLIYALSLLILTVSVPARLYGQDSTSVAAVPVDSAVIKADSLIRYAMKFIGTPYRLGAVGPKEYDCSSYVRKVYSGIGIDLPRYTWTQIKAGREVSRIPHEMICILNIAAGPQSRCIRRVVKLENANS